MPLLPLSLELLGVPVIRVAGQPGSAELYWRKHLALLARLALAPGMRASRAMLQDLLWPGPDESRGRRSLNEAIRRLRVHLGADRISGTRDTVELCPRALDVDVLTEPGPSGLRGELLEGIQLHDAPEFEEWLAIERHRIALRDANAVLRLASRLVESGEVEQAAALAGEVTRRHPLSCDAATTAMRAAALAGRRDDALDIHRSLHRALMDAGETVPREVDALAQRIRDAGPAPCVSARPVLLVGRERERIMLTRAVNDATHGRATLLLVTGDAGSGRTSLLALASAAAALGGAVVRARALPHDVSTPWSLLRALLRNGLANLPGVPAVQPDVLALLAWFSPALASRIPPRRPVDEGEVADAFANLLDAVTDEQPLVLLVDDGDCADAASLDALRVALVGAPGRPLALVLATAPLTAESPPAVISLAATVGRGVAGCRIDLAPLDASSLRTLVEQLAPWCQDEPARDRLVRRLLHETGGEPLMSVTLLESLQELASMRPELLCWPVPQHTFESPLPVPVPPVLRMAMLGRIARLDPEDRYLLGVAAWLGVRIDPGTLARAAGVARVEPALARLERARLVVLDESGYAFAAPLYAQLLASECLTPGERRNLTLARRGSFSRASA